jgi:hypothetical protein
LVEKRSDLVAQFTRDRQRVLSLQVELNAGVRPLSDAWLQAGIELLTQLHETSARLAELDAQLAKYRKH